MKCYTHNKGLPFSARRKLSCRNGMTMAEMLIVVAIVVVLFAVSFIAVNSHQRSLGQLERDAIAKEIFVAAQNHLTVAYGADYMGLQEPVSGSSAPNPYGKKDSDGFYYFVVNSKGISDDGSGNKNGAGIFELMLPFGSIDETVRAGGSYIIRYQKETGLVLDVFYCSRTGNPTKYNHEFYSGDDYSLVLDYAGDDNKSSRKNYINGSILGWYGASGGASLPRITLIAPKIEIINSEKLYVKLTDNNLSENNGKYSLKLIITGEASKAEKAILVKYKEEIGSSVRVSVTGSGSYEIVLDDITNSVPGSSLHFSDLGTDNSISFVPGENITIYAIAYSTEYLATPQKSQEFIENSLYAEISDSGNTAYINNIRHLENLDKKVSNLNMPVSSAIQVKKRQEYDGTDTGNLDWKNDDGGFWNSKTITAPKELSLADASYSSNYYPISPDYTMSYDGKEYGISNIVTNCTDAGLFGSTTAVTSISNLQLLDFTVSGSSSAGALAGTLTGATVKNVIARNSGRSTAVNITAPYAGGLIGVQSGGNVSCSASALIVSGSSYAGGLVGKASGLEIDGCYSGGHTENGSYQEWVTVYLYDVVGGTVGGLVGYADNATIKHSYSTCSAYGITDAVGGFIGNAVNGTSVSDCYSTGLVTRDSDAVAEHAFLGTGSLKSSSNNKYYMIINEHIAKDKDTGYITKIEYLSPGATGVSPIDADDSIFILGDGGFNSFVGSSTAWTDAKPYDPTLTAYYAGKFNLKSVDDLDTGDTDYSSYFVSSHYGDWPAPEIFFVNTPSS